MEDETGSGHLEFQKLTPEMHVQQLMIDLHDAHEENKQLREDLARAIEKANRSRYDCGVIALLAIVLTHAVWMAFSFASK
jgi:hypothetical protein